MEFSPRRHLRNMHLSCRLLTTSSRPSKTYAFLVMLNDDIRVLVDSSFFEDPSVHIEDRITGWMESAIE